MFHRQFLNDACSILTFFLINKMKLCILSWVILFGIAQVAMANEEIRVRQAHNADHKVKGMVRSTKGKRNPLTTGLPTPQTAMYEMDEGEHRSLRGGKGCGKRHIHSIFDSSEDVAPETQAPETQAPTRNDHDIVLTPDWQIPIRTARPRRRPRF